MDFTLQNQFIDTFIPSLKAYQDTYIQTSPVYFQGLETSSTIPDKNTVPDKLNTKPSVKQTTWTDTGLNLNTGIPVSVEVIEYVAPKNNKGWQVVFRTSDGKTSYMKSVGFGVEEKNRTYDWVEMKTP